VSIGILNESPLHQALKAHYTSSGARQEVTVGSYVADVLQADECIYEIQTGGFGTLRRKLESLLEQYRVVLVHPIAHVRYLVKLPECPDQRETRRRSPKRGTLAHIAEPLVSIPHLLDHPNFELEVVLIEEEELRRHSADGPWRRRGWRVVQRRLGRVLEQHRFRCAADLFRLVREPLAEPFTTAELALAMGEPRWLAQKLAYTLREAGALELCGKQGNALCYRRVSAGAPAVSTGGDFP
jgi:hypothetical protein